MSVDLQADFAASRRLFASSHLWLLERMGISRSTIAEFNCDFGFGVCHASEHPSEPGLYIRDPDGPPHLVLPVVEHGELIDLVAFRSSNPNCWLLRSGLGWCLGVDRGIERHTWGGPVPLAVSPLEWLQGGCEGLCILDWGATEVRELLGVPHLVCSNEHQAAMLRKALTRPVRFPTITVQEAHLAAA